MQATQSTDETWLPVVGYEGSYEVSDLGRVRSCDRTIARRDRPGFTVSLRGRVLRPIKTDYFRVTLSVDNVARTPRVQLLVAAAFIGPRPDHQVVCHTNGDPFDNRLSNLRYDTYSGNAFDTVRHGRHREAAQTECKYGHPLDGRSERQRYCITCRRSRGKAS